ncbi:hypothetical protein Maes01_02811 [Microbulbifer aestuariivivens]|uniref:Uncharacterized protein n=1 Tax=Microbulbifer aestuariivivens TaxID=1908308 RepID=A0ABP9WSN1_9GAMM
MENITEEQVLQRAACLADEDPSHTYHKSYKYFVSYFFDKPCLTESDLVVGANFTYGWMPTILNFKSTEFERAVTIINKAKGAERITDDEILILKRLINNSLVGVSKLLHFINPDVYAIWDSRVCNFLTGKSHKQKVENTSLFWSYLDLCQRVMKHSKFDEIHKSFIEKIGYEVSPMRTLEQIMFINSNEPLQ